jgi:hypothetical protein
MKRFTQWDLYISKVFRTAVDYETLSNRSTEKEMCYRKSESFLSMQSFLSGYDKELDDSLDNKKKSSLYFL